MRRSLLGKFLKHADTDFANDHSRLAQWLRAIDAINNNRDFSAFAADAIFSRLQKHAELSTFVPEQFIKEGEYMRDDAEVLAYIARQEERKKVAAEFSAELNAKNAEIADQAREIADQSAKIAALEARIAALTGK
ncbi:MAG: hypothetical protein MJY98_04680 [Fibrobacter sp.]|nr:hypothetical protein [Fibrobacter sp.]